MRIALLGWGSLLWDSRPEFDSRHDHWEKFGPLLKLEFSRISITRRGALTLVIDPVHGSPVRVACALSKRNSLNMAIRDLSDREGSTCSDIGFVYPAARRQNCRDQITGITVSEWAMEYGFDAVVWTDLTSNFKEKTGRSFSVPAAIEYLLKLDAAANKAALDYISHAPRFVITPLRIGVGAQPADEMRNAQK